MTFRPYPSRGGFIFLTLALAAGAIAVVLIWLLPRQSDWAGFFQLFVALLVAVVATLLALYWTMIAFKLHYHLNRNGLAIQWGLAQQRIPFASITAIIAGPNIASLSNFKGLKLAGLQLGRAEVAEYGPVKIRATAGLSHSLLVVATDQSYLISPRQPEAFVQAWQARQHLGPTQHWSAGLYRSGPFSHPLLTDRLAWGLLGAAMLIYLSLFGYLSLIYADLPAALPIHFNALGQADRIADKSALLTLPTAGAIVLALNTLLGTLIYRREQVAVYLLWGSAIIMQLFLWVALLSLTS